MATARQVAHRVLREWSHRKQHAQDLLDTALSKADLSKADRGLTPHLVFGVLRQRRLLDHWIGRLRQGSLDEATRIVLQLGLFQLFFTRVPDHAAVNETLQLAPHKTRGLVNAVLRRAIRERDMLERARAEAPMNIRFSLPEFLLEKWMSQFGQESTERLCHWCQEPAVNYFRRNALSTGNKEISLETAKVLGRDDFYFASSIPHDLLEHGIGYMQDPATVIACDLLAPQPGETVLDACAAPGGKTAYLAQLMDNRGTLIATDSEPNRLQRMRENLDRLGVTCAQVSSHDWTLPNATLGTVDKILMDVPCSNTGVLRRRVDLRWRLQAHRFQEMAKLQYQLCQHILSYLKPGGRAVYSTCSIEPEENEAVVERLLEENGDLQLADHRTILPHQDGIDGAFAAVLELKG